MGRHGWTGAGGALVLVAIALWWRTLDDEAISPGSTPTAPMAAPASHEPDRSVAAERSF